VTTFAFDAGQASSSRFVSAADQVGHRATRFDGGGKAQRDRMVEFTPRVMSDKRGTMSTDYDGLRLTAR